METEDNKVTTLEDWKKPDTWSKDIRDYDNPLVAVNVQSFDFLLGKLFTHFELLGLPDRQGKALRSSVRQMAWEWYDHLLPNPSGLASPSLQGRHAAGIEQEQN